MIECTSCGTKLTGGVDTFGEIDAPKCQHCFLDTVAKEPAAKSLFGIVAGLTDTDEFFEGV